MSGRSPHFARHEATSPPRGQRYSPHAPQHDHQPSSTLLLRGLAPSVDDEMILRALQTFRPLQARTIYDKATGEPRGFAFVDFESVERATEAMRAFESRPLVLHHRNVSVSYTDGFRRRSPDVESSRPRGASGGSRRSDDNHDHEQPRPDWICDECNVTNFARRMNCFQCNMPRTAQTKEVPVTAAFRQERMQSHKDSNCGDSGITGPHFSSGSSHPGSAPMRDGDMGPRRRGANDDNVRRVPPSQVLVVRMLPLDMEEGELHVAFAEFDGVQDIRLIRDRETNLSRGFGFVEFCDIEAATNALRKCDSLVVQNTHVEVSYARDTLSTRPHYPADMSQGPRSGSSMAVTALEQAQWSLSQGRGADAATNDQGVHSCYAMHQHCVHRQLSRIDQQNSVAADISALLNSAAAEVGPHFEEPKKKWPQPFETAGGSYMYASEYGLYWNPDSMFYYDAHTKVYYNSFTGTYYRCVNPDSSSAAAFKVFSPPLPADNVAYEASSTTKSPAASKPALSLSLKKDKKKAPGISFGNIKTTAFASAASIFEKSVPMKTMGGDPGAPAASAVSVTSFGMKRTSAGDIAKWSQRQREANKSEQGSGAVPAQQQNVGGAAQATWTAHGEAAKTEKSSHLQTVVTSATVNAADSVIDALTNVPQEVPICLLCRRKFGSLEILRKHEKLSKLHLANLAKAKENKQHIAAQYREHEKEMERDAKKQRQEEQAPPTAAPRNDHWNTPASANKPDPEPAARPLESGIGGKMLKMMGWKSGEGLGKRGTGITAPIKAAGQGGRSDTAGLGSKAPLSASVDLSDVTSDKERRQRLARARYDADNA